MAPHLFTTLIVSWAIAAAPATSTAGTMQRSAATVASLSFKDRCALGTLLAREMRDLLGWIDPRRLPGVLGDDGFSLLIVPPGKDDELRSLFTRGEHCAVTLDRVYPSPGKIEVRMAEDPPDALPSGRAYALLFMRQLARGRWQFDWSLSANGYAGCSKEAQADPAALDTCRHPAFVHGAPSADIRIVVSRKRSGFEAEVANLEAPKWTTPRPPSE